MSLCPRLKGQVDCDAVGFYCFAARTEAWKKGWFDTKNNQDMEPNWAIDTIWTNNIKKLGYRIIADFSVPCLHMQIVGNMFFDWALDRAVRMVDVWLPKFNTYACGIPVPVEYKITDHIIKKDDCL